MDASSNDVNIVIEMNERNLNNVNQENSGEAKFLASWQMSGSEPSDSSDDADANSSGSSSVLMCEMEHYDEFGYDPLFYNKLSYSSVKRQINKHYDQDMIQVALLNAISNFNPSGKDLLSSFILIFICLDSSTVEAPLLA